MNVLLLSGQLGSGGAPRVCHQIVRHLPDDIEVTVAYLGGRDGLVNKFEREGISVRRLGARSLSLASVRALNRHLRTHEYDLVHTHMISAGLIGRLLATRHGLPVVHTVHTNYTMRPIKAKVPDVLSAPFGDISVCVSESVAQSLPRYYQSETTVIYNCIDVDNIRARGKVPWENLEWTTNLDPNAPIVANVARYDPKKRRIDLVDSVRAITDKFPNVQLVLTGRRGDRQQRLAKRARELGVEDNVHFVGFVENPQSVYRHADVIALSSEAEGFSIGMLEAMAHRRPIVASKIPAFIDALGEEYPGFVCVQSPQELGVEICKTISNESHRTELISTICERIDQFSGKQAAKAYCKVYRSQLMDKDESKSVSD
ncbi:glycosyltransferase family 4 protein [Halobacteria archaeon AArc-m2/3/4]|uniref:Glycosyltransferase family 4 protein n=1 Tax=Natronoglomus mannanivorans TaxID=2979990 RepID=A0ABT2QIY0_9EURY|nr:glycosyltransferase family 4 protein [Halobacteria archaeon AArc-m2/3/4]